MILIKFATRSRPLKAIECLSNIREKTRTPYHVLFTLDFDDDSMTRVIPQLTGEDTTVVIGKSKNKIHAINRDIHLINDWDVLVNTSDDMYFIKDGWDEVVLRDIETSRKHVFLYPDGNRADLVTMAIFTRGWFESNGKVIYHPEYHSVYCDNDMTDKAAFMGQLFISEEQLFEHRHPAYGKAEMDAQYAQTESRWVYEHDRNVYERRKANNFA